MSNPIGYLPPPKEAPARALPRLPKPIAIRKKSKAEREAAAWIESINPLRGLSIERAQLIFDAARLGNDVRLQWVYANMEQADPTLLICAERRSGALVDLDWTVRPKQAGRVRGFDEGLAREQCALLEAAYGEAEEANLFPAIEHLASAFFRGHAHLVPHFSADGLGIRGFEPLDTWNVCRDILTGQWFWNPAASETTDFRTLAPIGPGEMVSLVRSRHVDYPAMAIYLRNALGEKAWGKFLERFGVPPVIIIMPELSDPNNTPAYMEAARDVADGGSGALPFGSQVTYAHEARGTNPFKEFLEHQQQLVVLMATGGMLTSLTGATGIGQGATEAHEETWRMIVRRDASAIATALNRTVTDQLLDRAFPGRPHLAQFDFETEPPPSAGEVFDLAAKAVQAGYQVAKEELEERTGYRLEAGLTAKTQMLGAGGYAAPTPPQDTLYLNKALPPAGLPPNAPAPHASTHPRLHASGLQGLAEALQADLSPAAEAVQVLLADPSPEAARALIERLPSLLPDDPEMAAILEEEIAAAFATEVAKVDDEDENKDEDKKGGTAAPPVPGASAPGAPLTQADAQALYDEMMASPTIANSEGECRAKDPATCPYHGTGQHAGQEKPAEPVPPAPKALPPEPNAKATASEYRKANRTRGEAALGRILADHQDIQGAMVSRKLGPIDFVWGREGNPGRDYEGGYGFSHIIAKHGIEAANKVPEILAQGKYYNDERKPGEFLVVYQGTVVSLKRRTDNFYVVSSYDDAKKATAYIRRGGQIENKAEGEGATC